MSLCVCEGVVVLGWCVCSGVSEEALPQFLTVGCTGETGLHGRSVSRVDLSRHPAE